MTKEITDINYIKSELKVSKIKNVNLSLIIDKLNLKFKNIEENLLDIILNKYKLFDQSNYDYSNIKKNEKLALLNKQ